MKKREKIGLFGSARSEVFRLLFNISSRESYLREMVRQSKVSLGGMQRELKILEEAGLILTRDDGNRVYFRANREHPLFPEIRNLVLKSFGLRDILSESLNSLKGIAVAFIFGSLAKGDFTFKSDVDLMVIGEIVSRKLLPALKKPMQLLGREINPYVISQKEFLQKKKQKNAFIQNVLKQEKIFIIGGAREFERMG
ncbi:MAG: nucleotidyltransferase domain-containing protein [Verrucomicrobiota bacterium]